MSDSVEPDFYLSSSEGYDLAEPRRCWIVRRTRTTVRDDLLLIRIEPPIIGQQYGLGARDIDEVLVATRHVGASMFPISEWPVYVYVARLLREAGDEPLRDRDFQVIAWAELHPTESAARATTARAIPKR